MSDQIVMKEEKIIGNKVNQFPNHEKDRFQSQYTLTLQADFISQINEDRLSH